MCVPHFYETQCMCSDGYSSGFIYVRHALRGLFQVHDEFAAIVRQTFQPLHDGWCLVQEKVIDIASRDNSSHIQQAVQAFHTETNQGNI